jgi:hypothetical protein
MEMAAAQGGPSRPPIYGIHNIHGIHGLHGAVAGTAGSAGIAAACAVPFPQRLFAEIQAAQAVKAAQLPLGAVEVVPVAATTSGSGGGHGQQRSSHDPRIKHLEGGSGGGGSSSSNIGARDHQHHNGVITVADSWQSVFHQNGLRYLTVAVVCPEVQAFLEGNSSLPVPLQAVDQSTSLWILNTFTKRWRCTHLDMTNDGSERSVARLVEPQTVAAGHGSLPLEAIASTHPKFASNLSKELKAILFVHWYALVFFYRCYIYC